MSTRIPPLLEPYLALPPETSLIVLTSILGASTNWLVLRYLHTFLNSATKLNATPSPDDADKEDVYVLLVSFLRDYSFWRDGAGRLGVDLEGAGRKGKFVFVDGLTGLFQPHGEDKSPPWQVRLGSPRLEDVRRALHAAVDGMIARGAGKVVLVIDQLDLLLATAGAGEEAFGTGLREMVLDLREVCISPSLFCHVMWFNASAVYYVRDSGQH
jgi:elongator complex protein 6